MSYYYEDTSYYCYTTPAHYDNTTEDFDHSVYSPTYIDTHLTDQHLTPLVELYHEDEIHPAYCYDPVDSLDEISTPPIQPPTTCFTVNNPPIDLTILTESLPLITGLPLLQTTNL